MNIDAVYALSPKPGDAVVIKMPHLLNNEATRNLKEMLAGIFPDNKILICEPGTEVEIQTEKSA